MRYQDQAAGLVSALYTVRNAIVWSRPGEDGSSFGPTPWRGRTKSGHTAPHEFLDRLALGLGLGAEHEPDLAPPLTHCHCSGVIMPLGSAPKAFAGGCPTSCQPSARHLADVSLSASVNVSDMVSSKGNAFSSLSTEQVSLLLARFR